MAKSTKKAPAKKAVKAKTPAPKKERLAPAGAVKAQAPAAYAGSFAIESDVAIPARVRSGGVSPYPFASLQPGQSFLVPAQTDAALYTSEAEGQAAKQEELQRLANRMYGATRRFTKRNPELKFAVRTVADGVRVWRVEKE